MEIKGVKLIHHNASGVNLPDDTSLPWRLDANFRPPEFMVIAFIGIFGGSETICVRGETREALEEFVEMNNLRKHPRLRSLEITQPEVVKPVSHETSKD